MKKQLLCALLIGATYTPSFAQPSPVKKAAQSVFSLTTFKQGSIIATTNGVFTANGEALSMWHPFVDADSAVVVDSKGNKYSCTGTSSIFVRLAFAANTSSMNCGFFFSLSSVSLLASC